MTGAPSPPPFVARFSLCGVLDQPGIVALDR